MCVARDHQPDRGIEPVEDWQDVAAKARAALVVELSGQRAALMDQQNDRLRACGLEARHQRVGGVGLVGELHPRDPGWRDQGRGRLQRHADEANPNTPDRLDRGAGEDAGAAGVNDVGSEVGKFGARERFDGAWLAGGRIDLDAAAGLHPLQFGDTPIELMIADRRELKPRHAQRGHRRLVEEQCRADRTGTDQIARSNGHAVGGSALLERGGEIGRTPRRDRAIGGGDSQLGGLEIAVEIVDRENLDFDRAGGLARDGGASGQSDGQQGEKKAAHRKPRQGLPRALAAA